jgi:hypothetical protein
MPGKDEQVSDPFGFKSGHQMTALEVIEFLSEKTQEVFKGFGGELREMVAFVGATRDPISKQTLAEMELCFLGSRSSFGLGGPDAKEVFSQILRRFAGDANAILLAFISEAWVALPRGEEEVRAYLEYTKTNKSLENFPGRKDVVMLQLEHIHLTPRHQLWFAEITEAEDGSKVLGKFEDQGYMNTTGRFANLIPDQLPDQLFRDPRGYRSSLV